MKNIILALMLAMPLTACSHIITAKEVGIDWLPADEELSYYENTERGFAFYYPKELYSFDEKEELLSVNLVDEDGEIKIKLGQDESNDFYWPIYYAQVENKDQIQDWVFERFGEQCYVDFDSFENNAAEEGGRFSVTNPIDPDEPFLCLGPVGHSFQWDPALETVVYYISKPNSADGISKSDPSTGISLVPVAFSWLK